MPTHFTIFDVETNGLSPSNCSVLSFSALHIRTWRTSRVRLFEVQKEFDRYYYPIEAYNPHAIQVNGLTPDVISKRRQRTGDHYPSHFIHDQDVPVFCQKFDMAVCHNSPFDAAFLKYAHSYEFPREICTMRTFTEYCAIPHHFFGVKWPKLEEAVDIICGRDDFSFHDSLADCYAVLEILRAMANSEASNGKYSWKELFDRVFAA